MEEDKNSKERDENEKSIDDKEEELKGSEGEEATKQEKGKKDEETESEDALERCSLSQRKPTESDEEVRERSVLSGEVETEGEELEVDEESEVAKSRKLSESEEEVIEVFETGKAQVPPILSEPKSLKQKRQSLAGMMKNVTDKCPLPVEVRFGVAYVCVPASCIHYPTPT